MEKNDDGEKVQTRLINSDEMISINRLLLLHKY